MSHVSHGFKLQQGHKFRYTKHVLCTKKPLAHYTDSSEYHCDSSPGFQKDKVPTLRGLDLSPGICNLGHADLFLPVSYDSEG